MMMMMIGINNSIGMSSSSNNGIVRLLGLLFLLLVSPPTDASALEDNCAEYPACQYDGDEIEGECRDYGYINNDSDGTKVLVPWYVASDECLTGFKIQISSLDPTTTCGSANSFVNALRFGDLQSSTAKLGLGVGAMPPDGFFEQTSGNTQITLKDSITVDGTSYDCSSSESDCYNAMKPYFESDSAGKQEMKDVCDKLQNQVKVDKQLEQSTLRNAMCQNINESSSIEVPADCNLLYSQVGEMMNEYPKDGQCSAYSFGIGDDTLVACDGSGSTGSASDTSTTQDEGGSGSSSTTSNAASASYSMLVFLFVIIIAIPALLIV